MSYILLPQSSYSLLYKTHQRIKLKNQYLIKSRFQYISKHCSNTKASSNNASSSSSFLSSKTRNRLVQLFKLIKYIRIPVLCLSVYGLGYQQGIIDYSRNPKSKEEELLNSIVVEMKTNQIQIAEDHADAISYGFLQDPKLQRIAIVGHHIIKAAQAYVDQKLKQIIDDELQKLNKEKIDDEDDYEKALWSVPEIKEWLEAKERITPKKDQPWQFLLLTSGLPNAFVSEILPYKIFVTTSLMDTFISNDDELALVLGHEISHLILGHVSSINQLELFLRTTEILLLTIDPTAGLLISGLYMYCVSMIRYALSASHSRTNEREADELGIQIAAMACFDTQKATEVFRKMHEHRVEQVGKYTENSMSFLDSHPPTLERFEFLKEVSKVENMEKYHDSYCWRMRSFLRRAVAWGNNNEK